MIHCKELNKDFDNKHQMFEALKRSKQDIIGLKKAQIFKSHEKGLGVNLKNIDPLKFNDAAKGLMTDTNYHYVVVNTTKILDSHRDLHKDGIWNKSINEQQGRNYLLTDHKMEMANVVVKKENVQMFVSEIPFSSIGKNFEGNTQALIYKVKKEDVINPMAKEWLDSGDDIEASVRMQYVNIDLAMNSEAKGDEEELGRYLENVDGIANKSDFEEIEYFWVVTEAKNIGESSLVLRGSNSATGLIDNQKQEPIVITPKAEPSEDTQEKGFFDRW
jgi:hypothetical protein